MLALKARENCRVARQDVEQGIGPISVQENFADTSIGEESAGDEMETVTLTRRWRAPQQPPLQPALRPH